MPIVSWLVAGLLVGSPASVGAAGGAASPDDACRRGDTLWDAGDPEAAATLWEACLQPASSPDRSADPAKDPTRLYRLYLHHEKTGDYSARLRAARAILVRFPHHRYANNLRNMVKRLEAFEASGFEDLRRYDTIRLNYRARPLETSVRQMERLLADFPETPLAVEIHTWLAEQNRRLGRSEEARRHYARVVELGPSDVRWKLIRAQQAELAQEEGQFEAAAVLYRTLRDRGLITERLYGSFLRVNRIKRALSVLLPLGSGWLAAALLSALAMRFWKWWDRTAYLKYLALAAALTLIPHAILQLYDPEDNPSHLLHLFAFLSAAGFVGVGAAGFAVQPGRRPGWRWVVSIQWAGVAFFGFLEVLDYNGALLEFLIASGH